MKRIIFAAGLLVAPMAHAQIEVSEQDYSLLGRMGTGKTFDQMEERLRRHASSWEGDGVAGYTPADSDVLEQVRRAQERGRMLSRYLSDDLDGDLRISSEELRLRARRESLQPLRSNGLSVMPSAEQIEYLTEQKMKKALAPDANGDGVLSLEELATHADNELARHNRRYRPNGPDMRHDADGDGRVSVEEIVAGMMEIARAADTNNDGIMSREEYRAFPNPRQLRQGQISKDDPARAYLERALGKDGARAFTMARAACQFPPVTGEVALHVVGGYEGSALTDLWFGKKTNTAEVVDITVPPQGPRIHLVAPFFRDTVLRFRDPGGRIAKVYHTNGNVGVIGGAADIEIARVHEACHLNVYDPVSGENPAPGAFYAERMGLERAAGVVVAYSLGSVNLETGSNSFDRVIMGAAPAPSAATAKGSWERFLAFNPGGFVTLDPRRVKSAVEVGKHEVWPQYAGVAALVAEGALVPLPRDDTKRQVLENDAGEIRMGGKTFVPGSGDDAIFMGGLVYTEERPKTWIGRKPQVYLMTRPLTLPSGLDGAHGIHIAIPEGLPKPGNMTRSVKTFDLDSETFNRLMKR